MGILKEIRFFFWSMKQGARYPLHSAAGKGNVKLLEKLLATTGFDVNGIDDEGMTPIDWARFGLRSHYHAGDLERAKHCEEIIAILEKRGGVSGEDPFPP